MKLRLRLKGLQGREFIQASPDVCNPQHRRGRRIIAAERRMSHGMGRACRSALGSKQNPAAFLLL